MTDYILKIMSYGETVPGATHFRGRVEGPRSRSCHGNLHFNPPEHRGKWACELGHVVPDQVNWDVDDDWTMARFDRYAARHFEGDGPGQFKSAAAVIGMAVRRFRDEVKVVQWLNPHVPGQPGDRLYLDFIARNPGEEDEEWGKMRGTPPYGSLLAEIAPACPLCGGTGKVVRLYPDSPLTPWRPGSYADGVVGLCPAAGHSVKQPAASGE